MIPLFLENNETFSLPIQHSGSSIYPGLYWSKRAVQLVVNDGGIQKTFNSEDLLNSLFLMDLTSLEHIANIVSQDFRLYRDPLIMVDYAKIVNIYKDIPIYNGVSPMYKDSSWAIYSGWNEQSFCLIGKSNDGNDITLPDGMKLVINRDGGYSYRGYVNTLTLEDELYISKTGASKRIFVNRLDVINAIPRLPLTLKGVPAVRFSRTAYKNGLISGLTTQESAYLGIDVSRPCGNEFVYFINSKDEFFEELIIPQNYQEFETAIQILANKQINDNPWLRDNVLQRFSEMLNIAYDTTALTGGK